MDSTNSSGRSAQTLRTISAAILAVAPLALMCTAQQSDSPAIAPGSTPSQVKINWAYARNVPVDGKQMYAAYCSPCHGVAARGDGPAVPALQIKPTDLTTIQLRNGGKFPWARVRAILSDSSNLPSKRAAHMPSWRPIFLDLDQYDHAMTALRMQSMLTYLEGVQVHQAVTARP